VCSESCTRGKLEIHTTYWSVNLKYETWSVTLKEEHRLGVYDNKMLERIFGPKREEVEGRFEMTA
jgi:hypothetical protein